MRADETHPASHTGSLPTKQRSRFWRSLAGIFVLALLAFIGASEYFAVKFTSPIRKPAGSFSDWLPSTTENVRFAATDGLSLSGWFVPREGATRAVVLLHGHGSHRRQVLARAKFLHAQGYAVLLYDARGHGESEGDRISIGWFETRDLLGALDYLRGRGFREFGLIGISQGAATIALAAPKLRDVKWIVLESVYPTLRDAIDHRFQRMFSLPGSIAGLLMVPLAEWRLGMSVDDVAPIAHVAELACPVFILHGDRDTSTLPQSAEAMFARAREPKRFWMVPGAAHVDLYGVTKSDYEQRLLDFIRSATGAPVAAQ
jgi:pimeloyl-ACP methyl ester carboxylesterase